MLTSSRFYIGLLITLASSIVATYVSGNLLDVSAYTSVAYAAIVMFTFLCLGIYLLSERAAKSKNKNFFMQIVMINTMIKMFGSVVLVVVYFKFVNPPNVKFIVPFLIVYILYSIFETYFMMKQSRNT